MEYPRIMVTPKTKHTFCKYHCCSCCIACSLPLFTKYGYIN